MAKIYRVNGVVRTFNKIVGFAIRWNLAPKKMHLLTVKGRKSGKLYSTPVSLVLDGEKRYLVSPYGDISWVLNMRASGQVTISRGGQSETLGFTELDAETAAPILQRYIKVEPITHPFFDVSPDGTLEEFVAEAPRHPGFLLADKK